MNECEKIQQLISCLIDDELTESEKLEVEKHIAACPQCAAMYEDFAALSGAMADTMAEVPAALHDSIMEGVKLAAIPVKKKKRPIIALRPYMTAAACLVVVVGAVLAFRSGGFGMDNSTSAADMATPTSASRPTSYSTTGAAESPKESIETADNSNGYSGNDAAIEDRVDSYGVNGETECTVTAEESVAADEPAEAPAMEPYVSYGFIPGSTIDKAFLTLIMADGSEERRELTELDILSEALMPIDFTDSYGSEFIPTALLEIQSEGQTFVLELGFAGEALIVRQAGEYYFASATPQEFLEIE